MGAIDFTPLYRNSVGFDRWAKLLDSTSGGQQQNTSYPPYNIEVHDENQYAISLAVAGFTDDELSIQVENNVLKVQGKKVSKDTDTTSKYLYQGIANRPFERQFNLADHIKVNNAALKDGLLTISLEKEIPEAMKPKAIPISSAA